MEGGGRRWEEVCRYEQSMSHISLEEGMPRCYTKVDGSKCLQSSAFWLKSRLEAGNYWYVR